MIFEQGNDRLVCNKLFQKVKFSLIPFKLRQNLITSILETSRLVMEKL